MMGKPVRCGPKLYYSGFNLDERVPREHPLRRVARAVDFSLVRREVASLYGRNGHESVDPTLLLKLLFLAFYENVRSERRLMADLPLRLDWLWFCGLDLDSPIPDHSVLSKARRRWGVRVFERLFTRVLKACVEAGLVDGSTVYADSTLVKASAAVESRVARRLWEQMERETGPEEPDQPGGDGPPPPQDQGPAGPGVRTPPAPEDTQAADLPAPPDGEFNRRTVSTTDPDAATVSRRSRGVLLGYSDHCLVDDRCGIVLATIATPADYDDAELLAPLLEKQRDYLGALPDCAVADGAYGTRQNMAALHEQGIKPYLKKRRGRPSDKELASIPGPESLPGAGHLRLAQASKEVFLDHLPPECDPREAQRLWWRRRHIAEGRFAHAHTDHGHRRARWRRRWRMQIQCYLVAMVQNVRKLAGRIGRATKRPAAVIAAVPALRDAIRPPRATLLTPIP
jgi:transposase